MLDFDICIPLHIFTTKYSTTLFPQTDHNFS